VTTKHNNSGTEPIVAMSFRMTPDQREALKRLALASHRTLSQELRVAIDDHLARNEPALEEAA
jgi:predicted transcriptional regulator